MINAIFSLFSPSYPSTLVYMLQSTEYQARPYLAWYWRTTNFYKVARRRSLDRTKAARLLLLALRIGMVMQILIGLLLLYVGVFKHLGGMTEFGLAALISYPIVWAHLIVVPLIFGRIFIHKPKERKLIGLSKTVFSKHGAVKIAVAGSYGKTSMKELLVTVLSSGKKVASTLGNENVSISHARFANKLQGDEEILIIEFGEGQPGDVEHFTETVQPDYGFITGLAPAHLDKYKTLEAAGKDVFSLATALAPEKVYVNGDSPDVKLFVQPTYNTYTQSGVKGWEVSNVKIGLAHTSFTMKSNAHTLHLKSNLLGRHQIGPIAAAAALAHELGLTDEQIVSGVASSEPYEHRMQPYVLGGAHVIDDTYNGNIEGMRAGLALLGELPAKRKLYVTPGLVDQGEENERVHHELGKLIAVAKPDVVVLMKNSVTDWIKAGLDANSFAGKLIIEENPLRFYENLSQFVAAGDLVLMQNDWTDNYN